MNFNQMITALPEIFHKKDSISKQPLISAWGRELIQQIQDKEGFRGNTAKAASTGNSEPDNARDAGGILSEYPRPQQVRLNVAGEVGRYEILNGWWKYAIMNSRKVPQEWDGNILVPFSPETLLSTVQRQLKPDEFLWYEKEIDVETYPENQRVLLHFGAVDQNCEVYMNGKRMTVHSGGYLPFTVEVTGKIHEGKNRIHLCVTDLSETSWHTRGKQKLKSGGMFYTAQSGIWQTVWLEWVPMHYIESLQITPVYDEERMDINIHINSPSREGVMGDRSSDREMIHLKLYEPVIDLCGTAEGAHQLCHDEEHVLRKADLEIEPYSQDAIIRSYHARIHVPDKKSWSPDAPWLYGLRIDTGEDHLAVYGAMRCFSVEKDEKGIPRLCLNHTPCFMNGVLDQGYWPESLMTPPADEAMISDIAGIKSLGFNMLRKHCKLEPDRWYYHCDHLGMLVWQDMVNGGRDYDMVKLCYLPTFLPFFFGKRKDSRKADYYVTGRPSEKSRETWKTETAETVKHLYNHPSIAAWVLFNEGWGQFDSEACCREVRKQDSTRFLDAASGWFDQKAGDMRSVHNYFRRLRVEKNRRPFVLSEYGGYIRKIPGHVQKNKSYGYGTCKSSESFQHAFEQLQETVRSLVPEGLCAAVYTQVSDIEEEMNGIFTYDRAVWKLIKKEKQTGT